MTTKSYAYDTKKQTASEAMQQSLLSNSTNGDGGDDYVPSQGPTATQLVCGTELFSDTIYSKPVSPPNTAYKHCLIDSSVRAARIKADLLDEDAVESTFSDNNHGLAITELVQLEEEGDGTYDLVYYQHPIGERTDGAKTEGLERIVIKKHIKGVTNDAPEGPRLYSSLAGKNNVAVTNSEGDLTFTAQCLLYVEINGGHDDGLLVYGIATSVIKGPNYSIIPDSIGRYTWSIDKMSSMKINTGYQSVRKFVNSGYSRSTGIFHEQKSYQHIVFNENSGAHTLTMTPEGNISSTKLYYPEHANDAPVMHIDWDNEDNRIARCVFYKASTNDKNSNKYLITQAYEGYKVHHTEELTDKTNLPVTCTYTEFDEKHHDSPDHPPQSVAPEDDTTGYGAFEYDWSKVNSVHDLYDFEDSNCNVYYVKLVEVSDQPFPSIVVLEQAAEAHWWHRASYPLKTPDPDTGRGYISKIVSCFSKFGGMRYFLQDDNSNLYLSRQQRLKNDNQPYGKPIYGPYDANGEVERSFGGEPLSYTQKIGFDWHDIKGNCYKTSGSTNIGPIKIPEQLVLSTLMAFDTNTSSGNTAHDGSSQAICLSAGGVVDVATPRRTYHDSEYVSATIATDESGSTTTVGIYRSINSLLERSWYHHEITSQIVYDPEAETQDYGDYYHLTLSPTDDDGNIASLTKNDANKHLLLEIRSDAPCSVTDMVSNYYHDINRYASFMAEVDPATNQASIVLKATQFGQNIYARLVDSRYLEAASESDVSLIGSGSDGKIYPWQQINISEQAQYRMNNTGSSKQPTESSPTSTKFMDTFVYVTGGTVANGTNPVSPSDDTKGPDYETKGKFKKSEGGMQPTANFINQSATNMLTEFSSCQMLYTAQDTASDRFNPLYCMCKTSSTQTKTSSTTSFLYADGCVKHGSGSSITPPSSETEGELGSNVFKKVSHDVGDALHHLQHLSGKAYKNLEKGVTISINAAASDAICIDKSIMKAVNGIDEDLNEAIDTVEQYASIVVEVLKTIIENSFMYEFIKLIMWLVSLFRYLSDIHDLATSLEETFFDFLKNPKTTDAETIRNEIDKYIGSTGKTTIDSAFASSTNLSSNFGNKPPENGFLNNVLNNPFTNKLINLVATKATKALNAVDVIEFDYDTPTAADSFFTDLSSNGVTSDLNKCRDMVMNDKVVEDLVGMVSEDIMHPQDIYKDFTTNISSIMGDVESDMVENIVSMAEKIGNPIYDCQLDNRDGGSYNLYFVEQLIKSNAYVELKLGIVGDLFKLCGLGSGSSSSLKVSGKDAIFFPMALALWVGLYITKGKSYSSVPSRQGVEGEPGDSIDCLDEVEELTSAVFGACSGALWGPCNPTGDSGGVDKEGCELLDTHCNIIITLSQCICFWCNNGKKVCSAGNAFDGTFVTCQLITTAATLVTKKCAKSKDTKDQVGMAIKWLYAFVSLVDVLGDVVITSKGDIGPEDAILGVVGGDVMTNVGTFTDMVYNLADANGQASMFDYAWPIIGFVPPIGYTMAAVDVA